MAEYVQKTPTVYAEQFDGTFESASAIYTLLVNHHIGPNMELAQRVMGEGEQRGKTLTIDSLRNYSTDNLENKFYRSDPGVMRVNDYIVITVNADGSTEIPRIMYKSEFETQYVKKE